MKKFFYFAFAAVVALANVACGDDDNDGGDNKKVTITKAQMADEAATYTVKEGTPVQSDKSTKYIEDFTIMDGGQVEVTLVDPETGETEVVIADVTSERTVDPAGTKYKVSVNKTVAGNITILDPVATSRGGDSFAIIFNLTINGENYVTAEGSPAECFVSALIQTNGGVLNYLCHKFQVKSMLIECEGDVKVYKQITGGNLLDVYNVANENGANLTEEDKDGFNKVVKYVSVGRSGELAIIYADDTCDGGNWDWANSQASKLNLWLKDKGMGNKFIPEDTTVDIDFSGNTCSMTIHANIKGTKNYTAALTLIMDVVK